MGENDGMRQQIIIIIPLFFVYYDALRNSFVIERMGRTLFVRFRLNEIMWIFVEMLFFDSLSIYLLTAIIGWVRCVKLLKISTEKYNKKTYYVCE